MLTQASRQLRRDCSVPIWRPCVGHCSSRASRMRSELERQVLRYRDVDYNIMQGIDRNFWKWSVAMNDSVRSGQAGTKAEAIRAAERAIDQALARKKLRLVRPEQN